MRSFALIAATAASLVVIASTIGAALTCGALLPMLELPSAASAPDPDFEVCIPAPTWPPDAGCLRETNGLCVGEPSRQVFDVGAHGRLVVSAVPELLPFWDDELPSVERFTLNLRLEGPHGRCAMVLRQQDLGRRRCLRMRFRDEPLAIHLGDHGGCTAADL